MPKQIQDHDIMKVAEAVVALEAAIKKYAPDGPA